MRGKPWRAVNVQTDIEASDEWLSSLTGGERGGAPGRSPASNGQDCLHKFILVHAAKFPVWCLDVL